MYLGVGESVPNRNLQSRRGISSGSFWLAPSVAQIRYPLLPLPDFRGVLPHPLPHLFKNVFSFLETGSRYVDLAVLELFI